MKCLIYQVSLGAPSNLYTTCIESVKTYCSKFGIDHIVQTEPILKIKPDIANMGRNAASFNKLGYLPIFEKENAFSYLTEYDAIAIVDADIYIRKNAPNIFNELGDHTFASVVERDMPLNKKYIEKITSYSKDQYKLLTDVDWGWNEKGAEFSNMGLMLFSNKLLPYLKGETPKQFISRPEFKKFVDGVGSWKWSTDQTLLNYWIRKEKMSVKKLDWKWNMLYNAIEPENLHQGYFIHFFLKDHLPEKGENIVKLLKEKKL